MIFRAIVNNLALLLALSILYSFLNRRWNAGSLIGKISGGILFGIVTIIGMMNPFVLEKGLIFDGRSMILCVAGVFGGPITATIAAVFAAAYRFHIGGVGLIMGILVIVISALLGSIYYYLKNFGINIKHPLNIYLLGIVVHVCMVLLMLTLPTELSHETLVKLTPSVLLIYPVATVALAYVLEDQEKNNLAVDLLRQSEERFRNAIIYSPVPIMIFAEDGEILQINNAWTRVTGYAKDDIPDIKEWTKKAYNEHSDEILRILKNVFTKDAIFSGGEYKVITGNGDEIILDFNSAPLGKLSDGRRVIITTAIDLTSRKRAEDATKQSEEYYRSLIENAVDYILIVDEKGFISYASPAFYRQLNYNESDIIGEPVINLIHPDDQEEFQNIHNSQISKPGIVNKLDFRLRNKNNEWRTTESFLTNLLNVNAIQGIVMNARDITEKKMAENELMKYRLHLEKLVTERTQDLESFTYSVSHDLKAPLRAIGSYAHIMAMDHGKELNEDATNLLNIIINSTDKMHQLIDDLLNFSRISKKEISVSNISVNTLIKEIISDLDAITKGRNIKWIVKDLPDIQGDRSMIKQVFVNLISNAVKFTKHKEKAVIEINSEKSDGDLIYFVKDNGIGFDMKYAEKLFQVFQRLHSAEEFDGSGVGLAIVKRIINKHGGNIWAEGKVNEGSVFRFNVNQITVNYFTI